MYLDKYMYTLVHKVDPDQTAPIEEYSSNQIAPIGAVWSRHELFNQGLYYLQLIRYVTKWK